MVYIDLFDTELEGKHLNKIEKRTSSLDWVEYRS